MTLAPASLRRWASWALQIGVLVAMFVAVSAYQTRHHLAGKAAPNFTLLDLEGHSVSLAQYRGKKVLLHFFATWCGVCHVELPFLRGLHRNLERDEVLLAIVEDSDDLEAVRRFAREHGLVYPILLGNRETLRAYHVNSFPTNYYVNGDGSIHGSTAGLSTRLGMAVRLFRTSSASRVLPR